MKLSSKERHFLIHALQEQCKDWTDAAYFRAIRQKLNIFKEGDYAKVKRDIYFSNGTLCKEGSICQVQKNTVAYYNEMADDYEWVEPLEQKI